MGDSGFNPKHYRDHSHVETKPNGVSWNQANKQGSVTKSKPNDYNPRDGTGFIPTENFQECEDFMDPFEKLNLNDAEINQIFTEGENLLVNYDDWEGCSHRLYFLGVVGYQSFSPEKIPLSHGIIELNNPLIEKSCEITEESFTPDLKVYSLISAWNDQKILSIVAKGMKF